MFEIISVKDRLPNVDHGIFLVYAPESFPKNSRWVVAEYYSDIKGFYSDDEFLYDATYWCELPGNPN